MVQESHGDTSVVEIKWESCYDQTKHYDAAVGQTDQVTTGDNGVSTALVDIVGKDERYSVVLRGFSGDNSHEDNEKNTYSTARAEESNCCTGQGKTS